MINREAKLSNYPKRKLKIIKRGEVLLPICRCHFVEIRADLVIEFFSWSQRTDRACDAEDGNYNEINNAIDNCFNNANNDDYSNNWLLEQCRDLT